MSKFLDYYRVALELPYLAHTDAHAPTRPRCSFAAGSAQFALAYLEARNGAGTTHYLMHDLPVMSSVQRYIMRASGYRVMDAVEDWVENGGVLCSSTLPMTRQAITSFRLSYPQQSTGFVSFWAFSEVSGERSDKQRRH